MTGSDDIMRVKASLDRLGTTYHAVVTRNLEKTASIVEREMKLLTPRDKGFLVGSHRYMITDDDDSITLTHFNNMEYSVVQHDNMSYRHRIGQAKFMEIPFTRHLGDYEAIPLRVIKAILDRG